MNVSLLSGEYRMRVFEEGVPRKCLTVKSGGNRRIQEIT
jgi:hypothetical protein